LIFFRARVGGSADAEAFAIFVAAGFDAIRICAFGKVR
jgi:hypothetical protein